MNPAVRMNFELKLDNVIIIVFPQHERTLTAAGSAHDDVCTRLFAAGLLPAGHMHGPGSVFRPYQPQQLT